MIFQTICLFQTIRNMLSHIMEKYRRNNRFEKLPNYGKLKKNISQFLKEL